MLPNVTLDPAATKFITRVVRFSGLPAGAGFRLTVTAGGCSGYNSEFTVEPKPFDGDEVLEINGLKLFLPAESRLMLEGVTIGFEETPTKSGLTFFNPNAAPCACSSSGETSTAPAMQTVDISSIVRKPASIS
ncbi:HesB/IscA family protein [Derxia gummosa]|uniref:HesB/IscA family protein n=1 Tax=Derxia gummosa DSM 723 TaxID=1121388 RepID=A0A8B6X1B6_9BURK|nr:iron-sulfur cluster assembly accessory protein [Derxia gummosa]